MPNRDILLYLIRGTERPAGLEKADIASLVWSFQESVGDIGYGFSFVGLGKVYSEKLEKDLRNWADIGLLERESDVRSRLARNGRLRVSDFGEKYLDAFGRKNLEALGPGYVRGVDLFLEKFKESTTKKYRIVL